MPGRYAESKGEDGIDRLLDRDVKVLAVSLADEKSAAALIQKAKDKRIPLVFFALPPRADDMVKWDKVYYVGSRPGQTGTYQGEIAAAWWHTHPETDRNRDSVMQYLAFTGGLGRGAFPLRSQASIKALADAGIRSQALAGESANLGREEARKTMAAWLAAFGGKVECVLCGSEDTALGAIDALKAAGWFKDGKTIPVLGIGAGPASLEAIDKGELLGTVLDDLAAQGKNAYGLSLALAGLGAIGSLGLPITDNKFLWVPCRKITKENLNLPASR